METGTDFQVPMTGNASTVAPRVDRDQWHAVFSIPQQTEGALNKDFKLQGMGISPRDTRNSCTLLNKTCRLKAAWQVQVAQRGEVTLSP